MEGILIFDKLKFSWILESREFLPDSYTKYINKIGLIDDKDNLISKNGNVALVWPFKDCILEGGQTKEEERRDEIFYNEILAPYEVNRLLHPKVFSNAKKYTVNGVEKYTSFSEEDNLVIRGNNLLAMASLQKRYEGKVKCVYIDIPYYFGEKKDGDTFSYNSNFKLSTWLTFHRDRLQLSKNLLSKKGVIFIHCNDDSQAYIKVLCDEIFDAENYVNTIAVNLKNIAGASGGGEDKRFKKNIEYIHVYAKDFSLLPKFKSLYEYIELYSLVEAYKENGVSWKYTSVLVDPGTKEYIGNTVDGSDNEIKIYKDLIN